MDVRSRTMVDFSPPRHRKRTSWAECRRIYAQRQAAIVADGSTPTDCAGLTGIDRQ